MRFFGIVACLIGLALTGYSAIVYKAPKIEADLQARAQQRFANADLETIDVVVDGRFMILRGTVGDEKERGATLDLAREVWGGLGPVDELERLTVMTPYRFEATKSEDGRTVIDGVAPNAALRDLLKDDAKAIFGDDADITIGVAAGAPEGDWRGIAGLGMDALATLKQGRLLIADTDLSLAGDIGGAEELDAVKIFADAAPEGFTWQNDLAQVQPTEAPEETAEVEVVEPYTFMVLKEVDGGLSMSGFAPDDETRQAMIDRAKDVALEKPVVADIQIADGMPSAAWPELVFESIDALAGVDAGQYDVVGDDVSFSAGIAEKTVVATEEAPETSEATEAPETFEAAGSTDGSAADPGKSEAAAVSSSEEETATATASSATTATTNVAAEPPAEPVSYAVTVYKTDRDEIRMEGFLPDAAMRDELLAALKEDFAVADIEADIEFADGELDEDWVRSVAERVVALKAVKSGSLSFRDDEARLIGVVDAPEDVAIVRTRLAAIDDALITELNPIDPRPAAILELVVSPEKGVTLSGHLPKDVTEQEAVKALGLSDYEGGLGEDGRGDAEDWRQNLTAIGGYLPQFEHVGVTLRNEQARIEGKVHAKRNVEQVKARLREVFNADQKATIDISVTELTYDDGMERTNPLTGKDEVYDRGHWLPVVAFAPGLTECRKRTALILTTNRITFLRGEALLDARGQKVIDELAAVATKCLDDDQLTLQIGGHTDARGATEMNLALSQQRADIVVQSLIERGVDAASLVAVGYGETIPISDNETEAGRAQNRRITFEWNESGTEG